MPTFGSVFRVSSLGAGPEKGSIFLKEPTTTTQTPSMPRRRRGSRRRGGEEDGGGGPGYPPWHATAVLFLLLVPTPVLILAVVAKYDTGYQR